MAARFIIVFLLSWTAGAADGWVHLRSAHFELFSEGTEAEGRGGLARLEQAHAWLAEAPTPVRGSVARVRIVAFASEESYAPYRLTAFSMGYFFSTADGDVLVLSGLGPRRLPLAVHEYIHALNRRAGQARPLWLEEGLAEYYSTFRVTAGMACVGEATRGRMAALQRRRWIPLAAAYESDPPAFYRESWAVARVFVKKRGERAERLEEIAREGIAEERGEGECSAWTAPVLEEIRSEPANSFAVRLLLAEVSRRVGRVAQSRAILERLIAEAPERPEALLALGKLAPLMGHGVDNGVDADADPER